ncbi:MAG: hypothetical protein ACRBBP_05165 [Bdellovibrionales bacterium]
MRFIKYIPILFTLSTHSAYSIVACTKFLKPPISTNILPIAEAFALDPKTGTVLMAISSKANTKGLKLEKQPRLHTLESLEGVSKSTFRSFNDQLENTPSTLLWANASREIPALKAFTNKILPLLRSPSNNESLLEVNCHWTTAVLNRVNTGPALFTNKDSILQRDLNSYLSERWTESQKDDPESTIGLVYSLNEWTGEPILLHSFSILASTGWVIHKYGFGEEPFAVDRHSDAIKIFQNKYPNSKLITRYLKPSPKPGSSLKSWSEIGQQVRSQNLSQVEALSPLKRPFDPKVAWINPFSSAPSFFKMDQNPYYRTRWYLENSHPEKNLTFYAPSIKGTKLFTLKLSPPAFALKKDKTRAYSDFASLKISVDTYEEAARIFEFLTALRLLYAIEFDKELYNGRNLTATIIKPPSTFSTPSGDFIGTVRMINGTLELKIKPNKDSVYFDENAPFDAQPLIETLIALTRYASLQLLNSN